MTQRQTISLAVGLLVLLLGIAYQQLEQNVIHVPDVYKPYLVTTIGFLLTVAVPSVWPHKAGDTIPHG